MIFLNKETQRIIRQLEIGVNLFDIQKNTINNLRPEFKRKDTTRL
jgi:hypothetical protein